jgi:hypothetical protein
MSTRIYPETLWQPPFLAYNDRSGQTVCEHQDERVLALLAAQPVVTVAATVAICPLLASHRRHRPTARHKIYAAVLRL